MDRDAYILQTSTVSKSRAQGLRPVLNIQSQTPILLSVEFNSYINTGLNCFI